MRCRFMVYCFYSFYSVVMYAFVAHWVWAENGWLKEFGAHDFAGSGPVHMFGAINGFIGSSGGSFRKTCVGTGIAYRSVDDPY